VAAVGVQTVNIEHSPNRTTVNLFGWEFMVLPDGELRINAGLEGVWLQLQRPQAERLVSTLAAALGAQEFQYRPEVYSRHE
jgi:hypothetical protein